jgi:hypothetical protein
VWAVNEIYTDGQREQFISVASLTDLRFLLFATFADDTRTLHLRDRIMCWIETREAELRTRGEEDK